MALLERADSGVVRCPASRENVLDLLLSPLQGLKEGEVDYGLLDRDQDGKPEARIIYGDESTDECDVCEIDDDEDGKPDSTGMDYDYDGKPDVIRPA